MTNQREDFKRKYIYSGAVKMYDRIICDNYSQMTFAVSEKQALNNIKHRYRKENGMRDFVPITLSGTITPVISTR